MTESNKRISFARVCVEVCTDSPLPEVIELQFPNGMFVDLPVKYVWRPVLCPKCQVFGHGDCSNSEPAGPKQVNKIWVAKAGKGSILADEPLGVTEVTNASSIQQFDEPLGISVDGSGSSSILLSNVVPSGSVVVLANDGAASELSVAIANHSGTGGFDNSSPSLGNPDLGNLVSPSKIGSGNRFAILNEVATLDVHCPVPGVLQDFP